MENIGECFLKREKLEGKIKILQKEYDKQYKTENFKEAINVWSKLMIDYKKYLSVNRELLKYIENKYRGQKNFTEELARSVENMEKEYNTLDIKLKEQF